MNDEFCRRAFWIWGRGFQCSWLCGNSVYLCLFCECPESIPNMSYVSAFDSCSQVCLCRFGIYNNIGHNHACLRLTARRTLKGSQWSIGTSCLFVICLWRSPPCGRRQRAACCSVWDVAYSAECMLHAVTEAVVGGTVLRLPLALY